MVNKKIVNKMTDVKQESYKAAKELYKAAKIGDIDLLEKCFRNAEIAKKRIELLIEKNCKGYVMLTTTGFTREIEKALNIASEHGNLDAIKLLMGKGAKNLGEAFCYAAESGRIEALKLLITYNSGMPYWEAFCYAAGRGQIETMEFLFTNTKIPKHYVKLFKTSALYNQALQCAAYNGEIESMEYLIKNGVTDLEPAYCTAVLCSQVEAQNFLEKLGFNLEKVTG